MLKPIITTALLAVSLGASAQLLVDAALKDDNETLEIVYTPGKDGPVNSITSPIVPMVQSHGTYSRIIRQELKMPDSAYRLILMMT